MLAPETILSVAGLDASLYLVKAFKGEEEVVLPRQGRSLRGHKLSFYILFVRTPSLCTTSGGIFSKHEQKMKKPCRSTIHKHWQIKWTERKKKGLVGDDSMGFD